MVADIDANLRAFLDDRRPGARYASFDYCYNHFQDARESGQTTRLADADRLLLSCLQLGFYLASWGMMRASGELLQRSVRELAPVVEAIATEPDEVWDLGGQSIATHADDILELSRRIRRAFTVNASDTLVTKTMLGTFGSVPAFDRYFRAGFGCQTLCKDALVRIGRYYTANQAAIDRYDVRTLDFATGLATERRYPAPKLIDMIFFQEGLKLERSQPERKAAPPSSVSMVGAVNSPRARSQINVPTNPNRPSTPGGKSMEYWAYENWVAHGHRVTVHRGDCGYCNFGAGTHGGGQTRNGKWHGPFSTADSARASLGRGGVEVRDCGHCGAR